MKKVSYLTAPVVILALFVLGCGQGAPNASSRNEVVPQPDTPTVSSEDEVGSQLTPDLIGNPNGNCCPPGFDLAATAGTGNPTDRNGDNAVCQKVTPGGFFLIDNNFPGDCVAPCIPPLCVPGGGGGL